MPPSFAVPAFVDEQFKNPQKRSVVVLNISGGVCSESMVYGFLETAGKRRWDKIEVQIVHADLGEMEHSSTPAYVRWLASRFPDIPFSIVSAELGLIEHFERNLERRPDTVPFPSKANRFCTSDHKRAPIQKWTRNTFEWDVDVFHLIGYRREESPDRAKLDYWEEKTKGWAAPTKDRRVFNLHPILDWTEADAWDVLDLNNSLGHPAYRDGNKRLSCGMCMLGCLGDLKNGAEDKPAVYRKLCSLEIRSGKSYQQNRWLGTVAPHLLTNEQRAWYQAKGIVK